MRAFLQLPTMEGNRTGLLQLGGDWPATPSAEVSGQRIRVTAIHDPPFIEFIKQADGSYKHDGYLYQLWELISRELDLESQITLLPGGDYGILAENGTWFGLVGELAYGRADVALTWLEQRQDRATVIDFIDAVSVTRYEDTFYVPRGRTDAIPKLELSMFKPLLKPLHLEVWWLLVVSSILAALVLYCTVRFSRIGAETRQVKKETNWSSCLLSSFMSLVGQGWDRTPDSLAARTTTMTSWILGMLICFSYTANMISHLTVSTDDRPIRSLKEFSENGWVLATEPGTGKVNDWKVSSDIYERELYQRTLTGEGHIRLDTATNAHRLIEPRVMTYNDIRRLHFSLGSKACSLIPLFDGPVHALNSYMVVAKGRHNLRRAINRVMLKLKETGVISRLENRWLHSREELQASCAPTEEFKQLSLGAALPVLAIVPLGVLFSVLVLMVEIKVSRLKMGSFRLSQLLKWISPRQK